MTTTTTLDQRRALLEKERPRLRDIGETVRRRLSAHPAAYQLPNDQAEIWAIGDFMSAEECARLRDMIDDCARPSAIYDSNYTDAFRTSYSGNVDREDPFVRQIKRRTDDLLGITPEYGEAMQGQRYLPGQQFKPHCDWFHPEGNYFDMEMSRGGQRSYTAMIFLNDVEAGGTTDFTELGLSIEPREGVLLAWNNATPDGAMNLQTAHAGMPVEAGVKYVVTQWYRTGEWN